MEDGCPPPRSLSITPGVDKGPQPLMLNPALTTCASERIKPQRFSYFAGFAARERMREAKPVKTRKSGVQPLFRQLQWRRYVRLHVFYSPTFFIITTLSFTDISYCAETSHSGVPPIYEVSSGNVTVWLSADERLRPIQHSKYVSDG